MNTAVVDTNLDAIKDHVRELLRKVKGKGQNMTGPLETIIKKVLDNPAQVWYAAELDRYLMEKWVANSNPIWDALLKEYERTCVKDGSSDMEDIANFVGYFNILQGMLNERRILEKVGYHTTATHPEGWDSVDGGATPNGGEVTEEELEEIIKGKEENE